MLFGPALALALFAGLGPSEADASARVSWEAPLECPDASALERRINAYLGRAFATEAGVDVIGRVRASRAGFVLELMTEVGGVRDRQRLSHHDCATLVELAASLAAIAIDPLALVEPPMMPMMPPPDPHQPNEAAAEGVVISLTPTELAELATLAELAEPRAQAQRPTRANPQALADPTEPTELAEPPEPPAFELYPSSPADTDTKERRTRALVLATAGLALNLFPNAAPQVHGGLGLQHGSPRLAFRAHVGAGGTFAGRFRSDDRSAGGDLLAWSVSVHPCGVPRWGRVELRVCAAFGGGQIRATGIGVGESLRRAHPWLWLATEAGVGVALGRTVALVLDLGLDFNLLRPNFSISNPDVSYLTPILSGHGRLGVELRFF